MLQFRTKQSQNSKLAPSESTPIESEVCQLAIPAQLLKHHELMELKATVWKQSLQSTYRWRGILWTQAMKLVFILRFLKSNFHANRKECVRECRLWDLFERQVA